MSNVTALGWNAVSLGDLARVERGKFSARPRNDPRFYGGKCPFIQTGDIRNSAGRVRSYSQTLNDNGLKVSRLFPSGTLFMTIAANIGDLGITEFASACPDSLVALRPYAHVNQTWLYYALSAKKTVLESIASQNAQANLNIAKLLPFPLQAPPLEEQREIAGSLSAIDDFIAGLNRMIKKKRAIGLGMTQRLLIGATRLPGFDNSWPEVTLGEHATGLRGAGLSKDLLHVSGTERCILYGELFTKYGRRISVVRSRTNVQNGVRSHEGDVLVPGSTTTVARDLATASAVHLVDVLLGGDTNIVRPGNSLDADWLAYYITHRLGDRIAEVAQGTTIKHLYVRDILKCLIFLPSVAEQRAIVGTLESQLAEVSGLTIRLRKAREIRQGMMQQLLTGRIRLPQKGAVA